jgi:nitrite reductase/ring-hydroxylating ferredoxin subunit/uncharacterized membrane protein
VNDTTTGIGTTTASGASPDGRSAGAAGGGPQAGNVLHGLAASLERMSQLDSVAQRVQEAIAGPLGRPGAKDALSGAWLGHALHPLLTDLPLGMWTSAAVLDLVGGRRSRVAARRLVGLGVLATLPTSLTGLSDWSDTTAGPRRVGLAHAATNSVAAGMYFLSWRARRKGHHLRGMGLGMIGGLAATVGGYLGGHLVEGRGIGVDHTAFDRPPEEWTEVPGAEALAPGGVMRAVVGETPVMIVRDADADVDITGTATGGGTSRGWHALHARCAHLGGPLDEGRRADGCVECPWHGSRFRIDDGALVRGPASTPQPTLEIQVRDGRIWVRRPR